MKSEKQTCPARNGFGPWEKKPNLDHWGRSRWGSPLSRWWEQVNRRVSNLYNEWKRARGRGCSLRYGGTHWPIAAHWKPRACSFCGCSHPDDVMKLLELGWVVDVCDNNGKCYVSPPNGNGPVPPVKVKTYHCTKEHVVRLNASRRGYSPTQNA